MSMNRVAIVANSAFTVLNFRRELICEMVSQGCVVFVVCPERCALMLDRDIAKEISELGAHFRPIEMERNGTNPINDFSYCKRLFNLFRKESPDVVLNYTIKPVIYSSFAAQFVGIKAIFSNITGIGYAFTSSSFKGKVVNFVVSSLYQIALRFNKRVFFQNPDDLSFFINKGFVDEGNAVLLNGSGINTESFKRSTKLPSQNSFLFIGRLLRSKGIFEFVQSAELLRKLHPEVLFSIAGPLDDNPESLSSEELQTLIDKGIVRYLGVVLDVKPYLESHQVLVLPSYREGTPRAVLEAMSMSMPIITTHAPGCRETVKEGVNGFLAIPKDTSSLLACMLSIVENPDAIENMGIRSREFVKERYDVRDVNKLIINTLFK